MIALADVLAEAKDKTVMGDLLDEHRQALIAIGAVFPVPATLESVLPPFVEGLSYEKKLLTPWYGRGI